MGQKINWNRAATPEVVRRAPNLDFFFEKDGEPFENIEDINDVF